MPAKYVEGTIATNHDAATGERDAITLDHPEEPDICRYIYRRIRREQNPSGEFGESIEDAALRNPLPYL